MFELKKKQSDIEIERETVEDVLFLKSRPSLFITRQKQCSIIWQSLPLYNPYLFSKNQNLGWVAVLSLTCWIFCLWEDIRFPLITSFKPIYTDIHIRGNLVLFLCLMLHEIEILQSLDFAFFFCSFSCNSSVKVCFIFTSLISFKYLIFFQRVFLFLTNKTFYIVSLLGTYNNQLSVLSFMTTQVVFLFRVLK